MSAGGLALGFALLLWGHPWLGLFVALPFVLHFRLRTKFPPRRLYAMAFGALVLGVFASRPIGTYKDHSSVHARFDALEREIAAYLSTTGHLPDALGDLGWRLFAVFDRGLPLDPWNNRLQYRPNDAGDGYRLSSAGADGVEDSGDDLTREVQASTTEPHSTSTQIAEPTGGP
jgi:hypothetical protein